MNYLVPRRSGPAQPGRGEIFNIVLLWLGTDIAKSISGNSAVTPAGVFIEDVRCAGEIAHPIPTCLFVSCDPRIKSFCTKGNRTLRLPKTHHAIRSKLSISAGIGRSSLDKFQRRPANKIPGIEPVHQRLCGKESEPVTKKKRCENYNRSCGGISQRA